MSRLRKSCASSTEPTSGRSPTNCATRPIEAVAVTGGHLGAGLGVVELTVALHYVFETPKDRLIWTWATRPIRTRS